MPGGMQHKRRAVAERIKQVLATTAREWSKKMDDITQKEPEDRVIWRPDLQQKMGVSSNTIRRWMIEGKLPPPDVDLSRRTRGWRLSTLHEAGIRLA